MDRDYNAYDFLKRMIEMQDQDKVKTHFDHDPMPTGSDGDDVVIVACSVDDPVIVVVDGRIEHAASCGHAVWLSPHSQLKVKQYPKIMVICNHCAYKRLQEKGSLDD